MTEDQARDRLRNMVAADTSPTLTVAEVEDLLDLARLQDRDGLAPTDNGWTPTFDLDRAAAEGWRWKAGKTSPDYSATLDGAQLARNQRYEHCMKMADTYDGRTNASISVPRGDEPLGRSVANG
jgi:hypothetical protein